MPRRNFYINEAELDDFQHALLTRRMDHSLVVQGSAGSGKTVIALHKAKAIQEGRLGSFFVIVFTKALSRYMSDGVRELGLDPQRFMHYHKWQKEGCPVADFMIADEAQDFSKEEMVAITKAKKAFFVFGDSAQSIYNGLTDRATQQIKTTLTMREIGNLINRDVDKLAFNHRLPKKIARFAALIGEGDDMPILESICREEGSELPHIDQYSSHDEELNAIHTIIERRHFEDVGVLFPTSAEVERAYKFFKNKGLNIEAKYEDKENWRKSKMDLDFSPTNTNPKLMTYHSAKGLQFEAVFLPNCHARRPNDRPVLYVAITRSYQSLYISHTGQPSPFFDAIPTSLYQTGSPVVSDKDITI